MSPYSIPAGPFDTEPLDLFEPGTGQDLARTSREVLTQALADAGVELGEHDRLIVQWLGGFELSTATTVASWIVRASAGHRAARVTRMSPGE
jgi:hypothetical protein